MSRYEKVLNGAALWGSYYRQNPDKFANDYLHLTLRVFQKILIVMMFRVTVFVFIAARGIGKSFLSAVYCVIRCILYPGTRICIASGTRGQAINVLEKITQELMPKSVELRNEISEVKNNGTNAYIAFKNTSVIKVVTASDTARSNRANVLLLDEYRLISKDVIKDVLSKFLTYRRTPTYSELTPDERKEEYSKEKYLTLYLSSAYFKNHWSYLTVVDAFKGMVDDRRKHFVCGFPYQLSIEEGLLDPGVIEDDMADSEFNEIRFNMEYGAIFYGSSENSFFEFDSVAQNRRIKYPYLPDSLSSKVQGNKLKIPPKQNGEKRILSADIALMTSRKHKNDATSIHINFLNPTKTNRYISNIVYTTVAEGLHTEDQALMIRRLYEEYQCDYIVLDTNGIGLGVFDCLVREMTDPNTGEVYPALSCCNDPTMAERCTTQGADKVIWSIKGNASLNSDCAFLLREGFKSGKVRLLETEYDGESSLAELPGFNKLSPPEKTILELPYIHTTLLIDEVVNLQHEENNGRVRIFEKSGARKDRYSSLSYNYYVATQLETKLSRRQNYDITERFNFRAPKYNGKVVTGTRGRDKDKYW